MLRVTDHCRVHPAHPSEAIVELHISFSPTYNRQAISLITTSSMLPIPCAQPLYLQNHAPCLHLPPLPEAPRPLLRAR